VHTVEERVAHIEGGVMEQSRTFDDMRQTMRSLEQRMEFRFDSLDSKMSRQFMWLVGMMMTQLLAILAAMVALLRH
jgi:tetrahydromethanopterin S-methyltransferase subunit B